MEFIYQKSDYPILGFDDQMMACNPAFIISFELLFS